MGFSIVGAIRRKKQIRAGTGVAKLRLISGLYREWGIKLHCVTKGQISF
jgi:hypothetical protein